MREANNCTPTNPPDRRRGQKRNLLGASLAAPSGVRRAIGSRNSVASICGGSCCRRLSPVRMLKWGRGDTCWRAGQTSIACCPNRAHSSLFGSLSRTVVYANVTMPFEL